MKKYPIVNWPRTTIPQNAKLVFDDNKMFQMYQYEQEMFNGSKHLYSKAVLRDAASVFAVCNGDIVYSRQEQAGEPAPFYDLPGGFVDDGETPEQAALRELREETGFITKRKLFKLFEYNKSDKLAHTEHIYIAYDCEDTGVLDLDSCEKVQVLRVPMRDFVYGVLDDEMFRKPWIRQYFTNDFTRAMLLGLLTSRNEK